MTSRLTNKKFTFIISVFSFSLFLLLNCVKLWVCLETNSILLTVLMTDGLLDILTTIITLLGVYYAKKPVDYSHRFGHGKAEAIAAFLQAILLLMVGITLGIKSLNCLITPKPLFSHELGIIIIFISVLFNIIVITIQSLIIKHTKSIAIFADRIHYIMDIIINMFVLVLLIIETKFSLLHVDAIGALMISFYIIWNARNIIIVAFTQLLDRELSVTDRQHITEIVLTFPEIKGIHDLRTRHGGDRIFVELHAEVDGKLSIYNGYIICNKLEIAIKSLFTTVEVSIRLEPAGTLEERLDDFLSKRYYIHN